MIWNGTDPLQLDHEVAYRGWPTRKVRVLEVDPSFPRQVVAEDFSGIFSVHRADGRYFNASVETLFDLIPLQQQEPAK